MCIRDRRPLVGDSIRIGFKLESNVDATTLVSRAKSQIERYGVNAVIANIMEEMNEEGELRARIVHADGRLEEIEDDFSLVKGIQRIISLD